MSNINTFTNAVIIPTALSAVTPYQMIENNNYPFELAYATTSQVFGITTTNLPIQQLSMTQRTIFPSQYKFNDEKEVDIKDNTSNTHISQSQFNEYRNSLISILKEMGASEQELALVSDAIIHNSIHNNRKVVDVAWAILQ